MGTYILIFYESWNSLEVVISPIYKKSLTVTGTKVLCMFQLLCWFGWRVRNRTQKNGQHRLHIAHLRYGWEDLWELIFLTYTVLFFPTFSFGFMILAGNCHKEAVSHLQRFLALWLLCMKVESRHVREVGNRNLTVPWSSYRGGGEGRTPPSSHNKNNWLSVEWIKKQDHFLGQWVFLVITQFSQHCWCYITTQSNKMELGAGQSQVPRVSWLDWTEDYLICHHICQICSFKVKLFWGHYSFYFGMVHLEL